MKLLEGVHALLEGERVLSHRVQLVDGECNEVFRQEREGLERSPVIKRLGGLCEHFAKGMFGATSKDHLDRVFPDVQSGTQGVGEIGMAFPCENLRLIDYQQQLLLLAVENFQSVAERKRLV
ncbi:hypothetical protein D3C72_1608550 [compost metagenome]